jgi:Leucine rich repeat variant
MLNPHDPDLAARLARANAEDIPAPVLKQLVQDENDGVRRAVAGNPNTPATSLKQLAMDIDPEVRLAVASNPNTTEDVLLMLREEFPDAIIENPIFNILRLEKPESKLVRLCLAGSLTTSAETLAILAQISDEEILCAVAENPNTPVAVLEQLIKSPPPFWNYDDPHGLMYIYDRISASVAKNPNIPAPLLTHIKNVQLQQCYSS